MRIRVRPPAAAPYADTPLLGIDVDPPIEQAPFLDLAFGIWRNQEELRRCRGCPDASKWLTSAAITIGSAAARSALMLALQYQPTFPPPALSGSASTA